MLWYSVENSSSRVIAIDQTENISCSHPTGKFIAMVNKLTVLARKKGLGLGCRLSVNGVPGPVALAMLIGG